MEGVESQEELADVAQETPAEGVFIAPSIHAEQILEGGSYSHYSKIPAKIVRDVTECVLGVDEAGRGPVLGKVLGATMVTNC